MHHLLLHLLLLPIATAKFVGFQLTTNSGNNQDYGCMPSQFSTGRPSGSTNHALIYVNDGCQNTDYPSDVRGKSLAVKLVDNLVSDACSVSTRVAKAKSKGALGVVFLNYIPGEVPYPLSWEYTTELPTVNDRTTSSVGIDMAVCLASYQLVEDLFPSGITAVNDITIDWTKFDRWDRRNEPSTGTHTVLSILSPMSIKYDWPAAQASFNPDTSAAISTNLVAAEWVDACLPVPRGESRYLSYYCGDCWTLEGAKKFQNTGATAVQDRILLFTRPYSICYPYFYDLALTGQNAGASAIVAALKNNDLPVYLAPHLVPFASTIPFLAVQNTVGQYFLEETTDGTNVQALVHAAQNGVGPSYFPPVQYHGSLPETDLVVTCAAGTAITYVAGQSNFNPNTSPAETMALLPATVDASCGRVGGASPNSPNVGKQEGVDCARCVGLLSARSGAVKTTTTLPDGQTRNIAGSMVFVWDYDLFCSNSMLDVAFNAAAAGATGVLLGNSREMTMTLSGGIAQGTGGARVEINSTIPMYNVGKGDAEVLLKAMEGGCTVALPVIRQGSATATTSSVYSNNGGTVPPSQIRLVHQTTTARRRRHLRDAVEGRTVAHITTREAPPGPFNTKAWAQPPPPPQQPPPPPQEHDEGQYGEGREISPEATSTRWLEEKESATIIEVGQTLFQPVTHPGFLEGKTMVKGVLVAQCSSKSCSKCNLYDVPLSTTTTTTPAATIDYRDKVVVFEMNALTCIRPLSQYVYFAERANAAGVLFISDSPEAHLETLGPESTHHTFTIPSFVVPNGGLALSDIPGTYDIVQFPAIVNHVASQTIGAATSPDKIVSDSTDHTQPTPQTKEGLDPGIVVLIVFLVSICCCTCGWQGFKTFHRRHQRGKLHAIGRMTHSHETQTFASLDALQNDDDDDQRERTLTANGNNFIGIALTTPVRKEGQTRRSSGSGASKDMYEEYNEEVFEVTAAAPYDDDGALKKGGKGTRKRRPSFRKITGDTGRTMYENVDTGETVYTMPKDGELVVF